MSKNTELPIERLEAFEERLGVSFEKLFVCIQPDRYITIGGELHSSNNHEIDRDIQIVFSAHNSSGAVLNVRTITVKSKFFFGMEVFSEKIDPCARVNAPK